MIDSDELLAIGAALVQTVRSQIKYSTNMKNEGQLFDGLQQSHFFKELHSKYKYTYSRAGVSYSINDKGKKSLDLGAGFCDGLSLACMFIAQGLEEIKVGEFYLSLMGTPTHTFVLSHCSQTIFNLGKTKYVNSFDDLTRCKGLSNAIIIDPWIYRATKLQSYIQHLDHSKLYNVENFYIGQIDSIGIHIKISPSSQVSIIDNKYIEIFNECYEIQKQKLANRRDSFARGRRFSSVRNDLILDVYRPYENQIVKIQSNYRGYLTRRNIKQQQQQQQQLTSLRDFFTRLNNQSSSWYGGWGHSDNKGACINEAITYLNDCINEYKYIREANLVNLFQCILRILPIVRSSNTAPRNLDIYSINMTKSAKGIFNIAVTPQNKYIFEEITNLNLDWIRDIRNSYNNDRSRYEALLNKIKEFTAPNNLDEILRNFYENKNGYYQLVRDAITH